jgi:hypothetical protein
MPAHRLTTRAGVIRRGRGACERLRAPPPRLPRPTRFGGGPPSPASAVFDGLLQVRSPFCGLPCGAPRSSTPMRTDRFLLPTTSTTSTRASSVPGISSKLSLRPWRVGLHPSPGDRGTWRFTTPDPLRWAARVRAQHAYSTRSRPIRTSDTSVASPIHRDLLSQVHASRGRLDCAVNPSVKMR